MAQRMVSLFWAPQASALPMTFWTIAQILNDSVVQRKAEQEARAWTAPGAGSKGRSSTGGGSGGCPVHSGDGKAVFDTTELPYITACLKEVLRMYIAIW